MLNDGQNLPNNGENTAAMQEEIHRLGTQLQRVMLEFARRDQTDHNREQQINELSQRLASKEEIELHPDLHEVVPVHLQAEPLKPETRAKHLKNFGRICNLPQPLTDKNGVVEKSNLSQDKKEKIKWCTKYQKHSLDIVRMGASIYAAIDEGGISGQDIMVGLKSICAVASDTAQQLAQEQLHSALHNGGGKGAAAMAKQQMEGFDPEDTSILQACHIKAVTNLDEFSRAISKNSNVRKSGGFQPQNSKNFRGRGGRGRGRGYSTNYRGRGQRGRGRGRGTPSAAPVDP
jgi:hypothetical protein